VKRTHPARALTALLLLFTSGCVLQRGENFGSWTGRAEPTTLVRITKDQETQPLATADRCLLLPITGDLPENQARRLQQDFFREACNYLPANIIELKDQAQPAGYASRNNLYPDGLTLDVREACRLGALLGVTHVIAVYVREYRPYHPQVLTLRLSLIDVRAQRLRVNMEAAFDATQQQLLTSLADYLQQRRARKNDTTNLDVMLRSPAEYAAFAASFCCKSLAQTLPQPAAVCAGN
jgi:hypothetical protein